MSPVSGLGQVTEVILVAATMVVGVEVVKAGAGAFVVVEGVTTVTTKVEAVISRLLSKRMIFLDSYRYFFFLLRLSNLCLLSGVGSSREYGPHLHS